jgi:hypothetical protein
MQLTLANLVTVNPDQSMKNEKISSQLSTYFKDTWSLGARGLSVCVEGGWRY